MGIVQRDGLKLTIVSYVGIVLGYVNRVLLFPNFLSAEQVGLASWLVSISLIYAQFSALGMVGVNLKFFPYFSDKKNRHHGFLFWTKLMVTSGFILFTLLLIILRPWVVAYYSEDSRLIVDYYYYIIPLALSSLLFQFYDSYLRSLLKTVVPSFLNEVVLRLLITLSITLYAVKWVDFHGFVIIYVGLNCSMGIIIMIYAAYLKQLFLKPELTRKIKRYSKYMIVFGLVSILSSAGNAFIANIDTIMVATYISLKATGIYATGFFITTVILIPYRSILKITSPIVAKHWKENDMVAMKALYKQVTLICLACGSLLFIGLWINIDNIFQFMPKQYSSAKYVFLLVGLGRLFDMTTGLNGVITMTSKKYKYDLFFTAFLIVFTAASAYLFINTFGMGMNGAAFAAMITLIIYNILRLIFVQVNFKMQPFDSRSVWLVLIGLISLGINLLIPYLWNVYLDILLRSLIIGGCFTTTIYFFKIVPDINSYIDKAIAAFLKRPADTN
jgi:O-antigen/teichoic acid export membrane protein